MKKNDDICYFLSFKHQCQRLLSVGHKITDPVFMLYRMLVVSEKF